MLNEVLEAPHVEPASDRARHRWPVAITLAIVTIPFVQVLLGQRTAMYEDTLDYNVPNIVASWRAIKSGHSPFWGPYVFSGFNRLGSGQTGIFYPPNALFAVLGPVTAYRWWLLFHLWLAAAGAYAWSWHRWRSRTGAMVSGIGYALCGFMVLHVVHMSLLAPAALIPWALLGLDLVLERWSGRRAALLAGSVALIAFAGHPQGLWLTLAAISILAAAELVGVRRAWWALARVTGAVLGGVGLAALQLVPVRLLSRTSTRPHLTEAEAYTFASAPRHLVSLLAPRLLGGYSGLAPSPWKEPNPMLPVHEVTNYLLITLVVLAVVGFWGRRRERRALGLLVLAVFGVLMSLAGSTPLGGLFFHVVPLASSFRAWGRVSLLTNLAVVSLAASGVRDILREPRQRLARVILCAAAPATFVTLLPLVWSADGLFATDSARAVAVAWPALLLGALCAAVALGSTRFRHWTAAALVVVCGLDAGAYAFTGEWRHLQQSPDQASGWLSASTAVFGPTFDAPGGVDRWVSSDVLSRSWGLVKRQQTVMGYDPLIQRNYSDLAGGMSYSGVIGRNDFWEPGQLADVLRVTTYLGTRKLAPTDPTWVAADVPGLGVGIHRWTRVPRLPEAYLVGGVEAADTNTIYWAQRDTATDLRSFAFVETGLLGTSDAIARLTQRGPTGSASGSMSDHGRGTYRVDASRDSLLVVSIAWLRGWHATVDGRSVPVTRANGLVLGVAVPPGQHTVRLRFSPPGLGSGALISVLSLCALCAPSALTALRRRRAARTVSRPAR